MIELITPFLPLANILLLWVIKPLYQTIKNQQEEIQLLKESIRTQKEELALIRAIIFDMADGSVLKKHLQGALK